MPLKGKLLFGMLRKLTDHIDRIKATKNTKKKGDARRDISIEKENEPELL